MSTDEYFYLVPTSGNINQVLEITKIDCQLRLVGEWAEGRYLYIYFHICKCHFKLISVHVHVDCY